ncbi:hypothetical protein DFH07DRAFT_765965 [Mycena maculata]|uniref:Uncharacterized protein n=1 Tax=Mycena maculata TaxID=230809 RepID=A0AAD7K855_9AGAR|nr:hypothetical protein DFH07DRAFT_765965 [Mycena maculata]
MCMRAWAIHLTGTDSIEDLLNMAVTFGIRFYVYYQIEDIPLFKDPETFGSTTDSSCLEPGFCEARLEMSGGAANTRSLWKDEARKITHREWALAFLMHGSIIACIAFKFNPKLLDGLVKGPSSRVTEHHRGFILNTQIANCDVLGLESVVLGRRSRPTARLYCPQEGA